MSTGPIQKILASVDLSSCSRAALEFACKLAAPLGASVEVLFVRPLHAVTPGAGPETSKAEELAAARDELHRFVTSIPVAQGVKLGERVDAGDARERIVAIAEKEGFEVIVLGTHGRTGRLRALAGSVAEAVVRTAACPVITVREAR
jgi:nucleotide-binding universal stress UspA family protein